MGASLHEAERGIPVRPFAVVVVAFVVLATPSILLPNQPTAAGLIGLAGLGLGLVTWTAGWRVGVGSAAAMGVAGALGFAAEGSLPLGLAVMTGVAIAQGSSARWRLNPSIIMLSVTLSFIVAEAPTGVPLDNTILFGAVLGGYGAVVVCVVYLARKRSDQVPAAHADPLSWSRTVGYAISLTLTTLATTTIALTSEWGHTGGWLIMTPFIVLQPYMQDGWRKAWSRAAGTVGGFAIASLFAVVLGSGDLLTASGIAFGMLTAFAMVQKWPYAIYAMVLTPAVVILESISRPVQQTAQDRLLATLLGVGLALLAMALAAPWYRKVARRTGLTHY